MRLRAMVGLCLLVPLCALAFGPSLFASSQSAPLPNACATETGKCVRGLLYAVWNDNGGVARNGLPITDEFDEQEADGQTHRVQYFERARLEYHQEAINTPGVVQMGLIGREQFAARYPIGKNTAPAGGMCFTETNHCLNGAFLTVWGQRGGLAPFGYPITDEFDEAQPDGNMLHVQYFERARMETTPDHAGDANAVTLGRLGAEQFASRYPQGQPPAATGFPINIWANTKSGINPTVASLPPHVYVPDETNGNITVIDPGTFQIIDRYPSGKTAHHVGASPDFTHLYVNNMGSSTLLEIDAQTGRPTRTIPVAAPYNLYFTTDGTKGMVAAEPNNSLDFYDATTWQLIKRLRLPCNGVDHADLSADGRYLLISCEFDGQVFKVDTDHMSILGSVRVGGLPIDIKASPDGAVFYVANQGRHGVSVIDPVAMREIDFLPTGRGAHGFAVSRDTNSLYVANRLEGTISTIDFSTRAITQTWRVGGSPDMLVVSPDGSQLWTSNRFNGSVSAIDTSSGGVINTIVTGATPHGLTYFPEPGKISIGHNGVYR